MISLISCLTWAFCPFFSRAQRIIWIPLAEAINAQHSLKKKGKVASFSSTAAADVASTRRFYAFKVPNKSGYRILIFETTNGETRSTDILRPQK